MKLFRNRQQRNEQRKLSETIYNRPVITLTGKGSVSKYTAVGYALIMCTPDCNIDDSSSGNLITTSINDGTQAEVIMNGIGIVLKTLKNRFPEEYRKGMNAF